LALLHAVIPVGGIADPLHTEILQFIAEKSRLGESLDDVAAAQTLSEAAAAELSRALDTFKKYYYEGIKNLISLGFIDIAGNIIFEEILKKEDTFTIYNEFVKVIDYIIDNNLENEVKIAQLGEVEHILTFIPMIDEENMSWCGSCTHMSCLGMDGKIYGCNRFCTMDKPNMEIATFTSESIHIVNQPLLDEVKSFKWNWSGECKTCPIKNSCASCVAATYEVESAKQYIEEKRQCGWTHAITMARAYFKAKLISKGYTKCI
jgi:radical SAM protein with 4Fe4S-binding SPASM domain